MRAPVPEGMVDWAVAKKDGLESGLLPFGQVPSLTVKDESGAETHLVQSKAILNFLAREHSMYGADNFQAAAIDIMIGGVEDLKGKWRASFYGKDKTSEQIAEVCDAM